MDVFVEPLLKREEIPAGDLVLQVRHVLLRLLEHLVSGFRFRVQGSGLEGVAVVGAGSI